MSSQSAPGEANAIVQPQGWMPSAAQLERAEEFLGRYKIVNQLASATGLKKLYVTVGAAVALLLLVTFGFGADALANIIGFAWPARNTLKALKAAASGAGADGEFDAAEFKFLTQYWLVFGAFVTAETFLDNFLSWVPYYFFCKVAFFVFCFLPQTRGAEYIVEHAFQPAYVWVQANLETPLAAEIEEVAAELSGNGKGKRGKASKAE